jgi:hypothetical protein
MSNDDITLTIDDRELYLCTCLIRSSFLCKVKVKWKISIIDVPLTIMTYHKRQVVLYAVVTVFFQVDFELAEVHNIGYIGSVTAHSG